MGSGGRAQLISSTNHFRPDKEQQKKEGRHRRTRKIVRNFGATLRDRSSNTRKRTTPAKKRARDRQWTVATGGVCDGLGNHSQNRSCGLHNVK